ncbi:putative heterokaryon incompatibility protein [Neofusicoccum parvum UCRNP2]|uniref:Putative heterokaryon incompatibility protein n=1 Tax=Botryosphaeria parva (strain UCR-NP2) TaxID=1287680 RepID=R1GAS0_BOTPV|nr:putative heterokaryon incompatibility protein [Neofusicoccum parvum UCRNP2]
MAAIPEFAYRPLDEARNEIRVISFLRPHDPAAPTPVSPEHAELVRCTLEHVSLNERLNDYENFVASSPPLSRRNSYDIWHTETNNRYRSSSPRGGADTPPDRASAHPRYHRFAWGDYGALSYTWGDQSQKRPILLNDTVVHVGRNLEAALRRFVRYPDYADGLKLWVDAICINQRDLQERSRQVRRMGNIFSSALLVTIWLGELPKVEADGDAAGMVALQALVSRCLDDSTTKQAVEKTLQDPQISSALRVAVERLVNVAYWTRTWIIQEKCLGPFNASLLFGPYVFSLIPLRNFLACANNIAGAIKTREKAWQILKLMELAVRHQERLPLGNGDEDRKKADMDDLGLLLMLGRLAQTTDPRDKLYGLMGMIPRYVTQHIEPDYSAPVETVFSDFGRALIQGFNNLNMVLTGNSPSAFNVPSWVPDLTDLWDPHLWSTDCNATPGTQPRFSVTDNGRTLVVQGFKCDVVDSTAPQLGWTGGALSVQQPALQPLHATAPPPGADLKTAIVRTIHRHATLDCHAGATVLDIPWLDDADADDDDDDARTQLLLARGWGPVLAHANLADFHRFRAQLDAHWRPWGRAFRSFFPPAADVPVCARPAEFVAALERHQGIVYPALTTRRGLFGASIHAARPGDVVAVVPGCYAPVLLRPRRAEAGGEVFEAVSHCYVEGLMRGEAMGWLEGGEGVLEDLRIV